MKKKRKNKLATIFVVLVIVLAAAFVFRGTLYRGATGYKEDGGRKNYKVKDKNLAVFIENNIANPTDDIESIIDLSLKITGRALDYSNEATENDPNKTVLLRRANNAGYAAFTASAGNYLIDKYKLTKIWEAKPVKGKLFVFGQDMQKTTKSKSFKDYDFVIFRNKITKREICVDPAAYDKFGIKRISKY